eukprot:1147489-Pelagomonas_calceolata.AAC.3
MSTRAMHLLSGCPLTSRCDRSLLSLKGFRGNESWKKLSSTLVASWKTGRQTFCTMIYRKAVMGDCGQTDVATC